MQRIRQAGSAIIQFIFFGNYFVGILALALAIESNIQLRLPLNSVYFYILISLAPVVYYTYAYMGAHEGAASSNPRTMWYIRHSTFVKWSQLILGTICATLFIYLAVTYFSAIIHLPPAYWILALVMLSVALLYYGLLPSSFFNLNLRNTGWLKPFIIGFVWACTANILPLILLKIESGINAQEQVLWVWLFIKNWMFCTVNAIMFDMKDYAVDANEELKTIVVRMGLKRTIFTVLIPLLLIGVASLCVFAGIRHLKPVIFVMNLVPFILTIIVAWSMNSRKSILFYLIVIDGLILIKALCGISGMLAIST